MIKVVVFDFDGTIADTFPIVLKNMNKLSDKLGLKKIKYTPKLRDKSARELIKDLGISSFKLPRYIKKLKELMKPELGKAKIFRGIKTVLASLHKRYKIGILTTNSEGTVKEVLKRNKINSVDFIFSDSSVFGKHKKLKKLMRRYKLKKAEIVYVGDEIRDIEACKKINVKIIAVGWGYNSKKALKKYEPDKLVEKPGELMRDF